MSVIVKAKIKDIAKDEKGPLNVSGDFADKLAARVDQLIREACERARENNRSTVMAKDL